MPFYKNPYDKPPHLYFDIGQKFEVTQNLHNTIYKKPVFAGEVLEIIDFEKRSHHDDVYKVYFACYDGWMYLTERQIKNITWIGHKKNF